MSTSELRIAETELADAIAILEQGREGASEEWVKAAVQFVKQCRAAYDRARRRADEASLVGTQPWGRADLWTRDQRLLGTRPH
jgi:hypothetical protein